MEEDSFLVSEINAQAGGIVHSLDSRRQTIHNSGPEHPSQISRHIPIAASNSVALTAAATRLGALEKMIGDFPEVDVQRVHTVRQALADRSYQVDPGRVAERLVLFEAMLRDRQRL